MVTSFDRDDIVAALDELVTLLVRSGASAQIRIVGGAAIALDFTRDTTTVDIDALYGSSADVARAVAAIAAQKGWQADWLNDKVKMFMSPFDHRAAWTTYEIRGSVEVRVAPADLLLAMKLRAARGLRDSADTDVLLDACGVVTVAEAIEIFDRYYPEEALSERARRQLHGRFPAR